MYLENFKNVSLYHGSNVECSIKGYEIKDAKIYSPYNNGCIWICFDDAPMNGSQAPDKFGYGKSWKVSDKWTPDNERDRVQYIEVLTNEYNGF